MRIPIRQALAVPAIVLVLLPSVASAHAQYQCRITGTVMAAPCCQTEAAPRDAHCATQIRSADCCERLAPANPPAAPAVHDAANQVPRPAVFAIVSVTSLLAPRAGLAHDTSRDNKALHVVGPPLFIVHCALLN